MKKILLVIILFIPMLAQANSDAELNRVLSELNVIKEIIITTELKQTIDRRFIFKWSRLLQDIETIEQGIIDWQNRELIEPKPIKELEGDYLSRSTR